MRNDERLRTIYEVMAPYIVRSERNWRDYLAFASRFHKQSFDNILLVYAQDEDVTILATKKQWAGVGRNLISRPKGIAVCVYSNARLTLDYLFDISQTVGKEIHPTNWQLSDEMQKALGERLTFSHGFQAQPLPDLLYALAREAVNDNYEHYLQGLRQETKNHLFEEIPAGGFEAQYIQLLSDSVSYFIGKKCHLPDEAIRMGDGMATVSHFNTVPLVAHLGMAVTSISKAVLLEMERNIRIINRERKEKHEQTEHQSALQRTGRDASPRPANFQQQRGGQAPGPVRADGAGISQGQPAGAIYDFENGWQSDGGHAPGTERGHGEDRGPDPADASTGADAADRGYSGANTPPEQSEADGGGNGTPDHRADPPLTEEQPHTEAPQGAEHEGEPPAQDGSLSASPKVEHHFSDEEVRRHYEHILTSTDLYLPELHQAVRAVLADGVTDYNWTEKGREVCGLFSAYGDREFQGEVLYRTKLRGEDGISFYFDDGYTYFPWPSLANLLDALIEAGAYPDITAEKEPDPIGDYNIPAEVEEMGGAPQREIGQADYDYVLGAVAYEAGETAEEPVRPQAVFTEIKGIPKADEIEAFVPKPVAGGQQVIVAGGQTNLIPPAEESPSPHKSRGNTTAHKNFQRFQKLFPEIVSGQYESLRLEAGDAYDPLVIHHKYGDHYCMEHYYMVPFVHPSIPDKIRRQLIRDTFAEKIQAYCETKQRARERLTTAAVDLVDEFEQYMEQLHPTEYKRLREAFGHITDDELGAAPLDGVLSADGMARFIPGLFVLKEKMPKKGRLAYKLLPEEVKAELNAFIGSLKTDCKYIGDLVNEYADAKCQLSMLYDADPAHVEEQRQKGIAEADKLIANKVLEAIRTMLRKDRETGAFEYAEARKAYYTERLICEILMALEQNAVNMGMEYDDCQKAMGGDLSKAAKKDWYLRHKDRGMEP